MASVTRPSPTDYSPVREDGFSGSGRSGHVRHASAAFRLLCAVLLASAAFVHPAQAQSAVLVSNVGENQVGSVLAASNHDLAQAFTTGTYANGYTLSSIEIRLRNTYSLSVSNIPTVKVVSGSARGTEIATLDGGSESVSGNATVNRTYTAPANTDLAASTTYYVVIEGGISHLQVWETGSNSEDDGGAAGWSIADAGLRRPASSTGSFSSHTTLNSFMIRVNGVVGDPPVFADDGPLSRSIAENTAADTAVGDPIPAATDADGHTLTYTLVGDDAASFDFDASTRQIETKAGVTYDHEAKPSYSVIVKADDGNGGTDTVAVMITVTDVRERPAAPSVAATMGSTTSLDVSWTAPDNAGKPAIESYDLRYRTGTGNWINGPQNVTDTSSTIASLAAGTAYQVQVRATNDEGDGPWSDPRWGSTVNPSDITTPTANEDGSDTLWTATLTVEKLSGLQDFGYFRFSSEGALSSDTFAIGGTDYPVNRLFERRDVFPPHLQFRIANLPAESSGWVLYLDGTAFRVSDAGSTDIMGLRFWNNPNLNWANSDSVAVRLVRLNAPTRPSNLTASAVNSTHIGLSWSAPETIGGSDIAGYKIEVSTDGVNNWSTLVADTSSTDTAYSHRGLMPGNTRHYRVSAINAIGTSPVSNMASATTVSDITTPTANADGSDTLWTATLTVEEVQSGQVGYDRGQSKGTLSSDTFTIGSTDYPVGKLVVNSSATPKLQFFQLNPGFPAERSDWVLYLDETAFHVSDATVAGNGALIEWNNPGLNWADEDEVAVRLVRLNKPTAPSNLHAKGVSGTQIDLSWFAPETAGGSDIAGYKIEVSTDSANTWTDLVADTSSTETAYSDTGLSMDDTRHYRVSAINAIGTSPVSNTASGTAADTGPGVSRAAIAGSGTVVTLDLDEDADSTSRPAASAFTVRVEGDERTVNSVAIYTIDPDTILLFLANAVKPGETVTVSYTKPETNPLKDAQGNESASFTDLAVNNKIQPTAPDAPGNLTASPRSVAMVLTWDTPWHNASPIEEFEVRHAMGTSVPSSTDWTDIPGSGAGTTSHTVTDLDSTTEYTFEVRAVNGIGAGAQASVTQTTANVVEPPLPQTEVAADWALIPSGLSAGDSFRLLFVSSTTRDGTSTDIADYNSHVQSAAAAGHTNIQSYSSGFRAVGSTLTVDARDNTSTTGTGVAIYWLGGAKVADDYADFYDGSWDSTQAKEESGTGFSGTRVWTGTANDGTANGAAVLGRVGGGPRLGSPADAGKHFVISFGTVTDPYPLYALSEVFTVAAAVVTTNTAPAFSDTALTRSIAENTAAGTAVGDPIPAATDADGDTLTYTLQGADKASFDFDASTRQIKTKAGVSYDHEADPSYEVTIKADDGNGGTDTVEVSISITDAKELPAAPAAPSVAAASPTSLDVSWTAPGNAGKPAISTYDLRYRVDGAGDNWSNGPQDVAGTSSTIASLTADTAYRVQVRATNEEGDGPWSGAGAGNTHATGFLVGNVWQTETDDREASSTFDLAQAFTTGANAYGYALSGIEVRLENVSATIATLDIPTVKVVSGSATGTVIATLDPGVEHMDAVATRNFLLTAPANTGLAASTNYYVVIEEGSTHLRVLGTTSDSEDSGGATGWSIADNGLFRGSTSTDNFTNIVQGYSFMIRVNGTVNASNIAPVFSDDMLSRSLAENTAAGTAVGDPIPAAADANGDTLTYTLLEGDDAASFDFDASTRQIETKDGVTYDFEDRNGVDYSVTIKADDGNGGADTVEVTITLTDVVEDTLALTLDAIATDDTVNIAEKAAGFSISGATGTEAGVTVSVTIGSTDLTATTADVSGTATWSVAVPPNASYIAGTSVGVTVSASKTGFTSPSDVTRTLAIDLAAPAVSYTAPPSLKVGEAITAMSPSTGDTDIASYGATGLPSGLAIDAGTGTISGTPDTADANAASVTVTVTDTAGNPADVSITFPAVAKGEQTLSGFAYSPDTVTFGGTAPTLTAPSGAVGTLGYTATPSTVCSVGATTGALTIVGVGDCAVTATAAGTDNYNEATAMYTVTVNAAGTLSLNLNAIAGDGTVNIAEKTAGFAISGDTGTEAGVTVSVTIGSTALTATSADVSGTATWSVAVPPAATYIAGTSVDVTVSASKTGFTDASDVERTLAIDLTAPAVSYTAPPSLKVGEAITAMSPSTGDTDIASYSATGLPSGLVIDGTAGTISGTPDTADANAASATVTVTDTAGNPADVSITFPAVAKGEQTLSGFAYSPDTVTFGGTAPTLTAPSGAVGTLGYTATPSTVCSVGATTGALTIVGVGDCEVTATAAGTDNYDEATAMYTVTVQAAPATEPGKPTGLTVGSVTPTKIPLTWTAPTDNGGAEITGYTVERAPDDTANPGNPGTWGTAGTASTTSYTDTGLTPETTYHYRVSATNSEGSSPYSDAVSGTTAALPVVTIVPRNATVTEGAHAEFLIRRAGNAGDAIAVLVAQSGSANIGVAAGNANVNLAAGASTAIHRVATENDDADEDNGTATVRLRNPTDDGVTLSGYTIGATDSATVTVEDDDTVPGVPSVNARGKDREIEVNWGKPSEGTSTITGYDYRFKISSESDDNFTAWADTGRDGLLLFGQYTIENLDNGTEYTVEIRAKSAAGTGLAGSDTATPDAPPAIASVAIASNPGTDKTYAIDDDIVVTVTFNKTLTLGAGTDDPFIALDIGAASGNGARAAACVLGTGSTTLVCTYTVADGDEDTDGIGIASDSIDTAGRDLNGPLGQGAKLEHPAIAQSSDHKVDGIRPTVASASAGGTTLTVEWSENLNTAAPAAGRFTLSVDSGAAPAVSAASIAGSTLTLTLSSAISGASKTYTLAYDVPSANPIEDLVGNDAAAIAAQAIALATDATLSALALSDGTNAVTLDPAFASATTDYTATVGHAVETVTVAAMPNNGKATVAYADGTGMALADADTVADDLQVSLAVGANTVRAVVTAPDGTTMQTYEVVVTRALPLPVISIAAAKSPVVEGTDAAAAFTLTRAGATDEALTVSVEIDTGDGGVFGDLAADLADHSIEATIASGASTATLSYAIGNDDVVHDGGYGAGDDFVTATVVAAAGYTVSDSAGEATVGFEDDDELDFQFKATPNSVEEGESFEVSLAGTNGKSYYKEVTGNFLFSSGTADFSDVIVYEEKYVLAAEATSVSQTIAIADDVVVEGEERFEVVLQILQANLFGSYDVPATVVAVTIEDNDMPNWTVSVSETTIAEDGGESVLTLDTGGVTYPENQDFVFNSGGSTATSDDFTVTPVPMVLAARKTTATATIAAVNDDAVEGDEEIVLRVAFDRRSEFVGAQKTVTIADDDLGLTVDAIATDDTVNIAEKTAGFAISGATGTEAGVSVSVTIGSESPLSATSDMNGAWSVDVPPDAAYIAGTSVDVTVSASKTGITSPSDVTRTLAIDLTAPSVSYTAPPSLKVGEAITAMSPSTGDTDIASYSATGLPSGLVIDGTAGTISGTPDTADANAASATVTVTDTAGNPADVSIAFPAVAKGDQTLTGFAYISNSVTFGDTAPTLTAPTGAVGTLGYTATPSTVCSVGATTGALTIAGVGDCMVTATAAGTDNYNEATALYTVTVSAAGTLSLNLNAIAGDGTVNIAEKTAGFSISGDTGTEAGVTVSVTIGSTALTATSADVSGTATWSVAVPPNASYIAGTSVGVTVSASKTGFTAPSDVERTLAIDLAAPAVSYTAPPSLKVGEAITAMSPSTGDTDIASYSATGLPSGLVIDGTAGTISGTPDTAEANAASATVTVTDTAGNPADVSIAFPAVAKGEQTLTGFAYSSNSVTFGDTAPTLTAPTGAVGTLGYTATPSTVCSVGATTGALTIAGVGDCMVTATAAGTDNYDQATATYTVTVYAVGTLSLNLNAIAGDGTVNIAEKTAGFAISGATGTEAGVTVSVTIGSTALTATSADVSGTAAWSVAVPANASYIAGTSVSVSVSASKTGFASPSAVTRTLAVDLTAPAVSYTAPPSLKVGEAITAMSPSTGDTDIASYGATGLPSGLDIDDTTGTISGTPDTADANAASATVTVTDTAGNPADVSIAFPAVDKGDQTLTGFAYSSNSVTFGDTAPTLTAPTGAVGTLGYTATPSTVCSVGATTGALTIAGVGDCDVTATAAGTDNYNEATALYTVTVNAIGTLSLNLNAIATDNTVNIAEKTAGFAISGDTGTEAGVTVSVTIGSTALTATSADVSGTATWSVAVPANASYIAGTSVSVSVSASKTGFTSPSDVERTLAVDLTAPTAPSYTAPGSLKVGVAMTAIGPSGGSGIDEYSAAGLPSGLTIDTGTGTISGTPDTAETNAANVTVTVSDSAGNTATVDITFPAVAKGDQTLTGFAYSSNSVTFGDTAPTLMAPTGAVGTLGYTATPNTVCTVNATTGALTIAGVGDCMVTATAAGTANYNQATATYTVTVNAAGTLSLNLNAIAGDNTVNLVEKVVGFSISGDTGTEEGVTVSVAVGSTTLTATSDSSGAWSVAVPPAATYIAGTSVDVTVSASKTGLIDASDVTRTLTIDLTAPTAPSYTAPGSLKVGEAIAAMSPTGGSGIDEYNAFWLPSGLAIDAGTGAISGTPDTAEANTAEATVTFSDSAGNRVAVTITFPAVAKGDQTLTGFAYSADSVTFGSTAPTLMSPSGAVGTLGYTATPTTVCTVNATTGALTIAGVGDCAVTATAAGTDNYNEATATYTVTVNGVGTLSLNLDAIATDNTVNIAEKTAGFSISGDTGTEAGVTVSVTIGLTALTATSADVSGTAAWSVAVPANASYIAGTSVSVSVSASKTGFTSPSDVERPLAIDLAAPAVSYTAPPSLKVGEAITAMSPSTGDTDIASYGATGLPSGLVIDGTAGTISGTPDTADANAASATVTVTDTAGNPADVSIAFPAVAKGDQTLTGFAYSSNSVTFGDTAPTLTAPSGAVGTLGYTATPSTVCTVNATTGALTIVGVGDCAVTATAAGTDNYNEATATYTVTVQSAGVAVSFAAASLSVGEGDQATVTVTLAEAPASPVTVPIAATPGAGFGTSEYSGVPSSVTFNAGETSKSFTVTAAQDTDDEPDRVLTLGIGTLPAGYVPGTHAEFVLTVVDDDAPVVLATFARAAASVPEGASTTVMVRLSQAPEREVVLPIAATPGANLAADEFSGVPSSVTFAADATEAEFTVAFGDDAAVEGNETLTLAFGARPERVTLGANPQLVLTVTDDDGRPAPPAAPSVTATPGATTSLDAAWTAPENAGKPDIESYDLRYRVDGGANTWSNGPQDVTETSSSIAGLTAGTAYEVQVRATNAEGDGAWSASGAGRTDSSPVMFPHDRLSRSIPENTEPDTDVGDPIPAATDADNDTLTYTMEGDEAGEFDFNAATRQIETRDGVTYDFEAKDTYSVTVRADDGNGGADTVEVIVSLTDVDEPPAAPAAPSVTATSPTSLDVAWTAPENAGKPDIESYDLRYRVDGGANTWSNGPRDVTGTSSTISNLTKGTAYDVQVRATNDEDDGPWSASGTGSTHASVATIRSKRAREIEGGWIALTVKLTPPIEEADTEVRVVAEDPDGALAPPHPSIDPRAPFLLSFPAGVDEIVYPVRLADDAAPNPARTVVFRLQTNEDFPHYGLGAPAAATVTVLDNDAVPAAPAGLEVALAPHRPARDRVVLSWDLPEEIADYWLEHTALTYRARDRYQVRYRPSGAGAPAWADDDWTDLKIRNSLNSPGVAAGRIEAEVGGLEKGTAYDFEVRGANQAGFGAAAGVTFAPPPLTVAGSEETAPTNDAAPLTASFGSVPAQHNGLTPFTFRLSFSAEPEVGSAVLRHGADGAFTVSGGAVTGARRAAPSSNRGWEITVTPTGFGDIAIRLPGTSDCNAAGAICTADGRPLSNSSSATVRLMPGLSVADTEVTEAPGAKAHFVVTLDRSPSAPVTVGYETVDGTALARYDYEPASGTLRFAPGETRKTVSVTVLDDAHDDDGETFELRLFYYPTGAWLADAEATATIRNADPLPEAWLARFGRTSSVHVVEAIGGRLRSAQRATPETHFTLGGRTVGGLFSAWDGIGAAFAPTGDDTANPALADESTWARIDRLRAESLAGGSLAGSSPAGGHLVGGGLAGPAGGNPQGSNLYGNSLSGRNPADSATSGSQAARSMLMNGLGLPTGDLRDALMGSSFFYSRALDEDGQAGGPGWLGQWSAWGETAATRFSGADGPLSLSGEVATAILGADSRWGRWLAGVTLSHSLGEGEYTHTEALGGALTSTVTSVNPYAHYQLSDRTNVWGVLGYGVGGLTLTPEGAEAGIETDLSNRMAAFGGRGVLSRRSGGFELALASDALMTSTVSESVENLVGATGQTSRLRVMLEGSGSMPLSGGVLRPSLEAGLRYDDGDAETGAGIEVGGGLGYAAGRLAVQVNGRVLLAHEDTEYEEWGFSGSIAYRPNGDGRGLSANLGSTWGDTRSGVQRLWALDNARGLAPRAAMNAAQRFQAELGYGLRGRHVFAGRRGQALWYPYVGAEGVQGGAAALTLGLKLSAGQSAEAALELGRRDSARHRGTRGGIEGPEHAIQLNGSIRW